MSSSPELYSKGNPLRSIPAFFSFIEILLFAILQVVPCLVP